MTNDMEQLNRSNFRYCLEALARPGDIFPLMPFAGSNIMAMATMLLYSEVGFYQEIDVDWDLIKALTNTVEVERGDADYLFLQSPREEILLAAKSGDQQNPEFSAVLICACEDLGRGTRVNLTGPGINGVKQTTLPVSGNFLNLLAAKNSHFPLGVELFLIADSDEICALSRTTRVEIV
jgi:alpha-D-ribose 1-methylphosphonate 5-triphosphate synthase subunit PhnH